MNLIGLYTLFCKEVLRFGKVLLQTLIAPVITALLYLLVFGHVFEGRVQAFPGVSYTMFLIPGLVMMSVIQNAFANSSSSLIQSKVTGNIVFMMLTPLSHLEFFLAFVLAAVVRGILVGVGVYLVALVFTAVPIKHPGFILLFMFLGSATLGAIGVIAGIWAEKFDQLAGFQNFIILPLSFLSGVFYSIHSLPEFWQRLSHFNPFFYMIDGFRYGFFGVSDTAPSVSLAIVTLFLVVLSGITLVLLKTGYKLRD
ncbi:MAG: metal-dependent hydrolase [Candidatus Muproteobacteria bacterium RIFCSPHIGHO2_12_FULL_60_33]|nr:MAG: metal-dependent hydrolase [Candidatus Muproteobacteria bacterium RIFCSPHIGHO2_01_60_12]OGI54822.1 MAG: metal-dependent hydrolase [Candidatus Muproteobacteria bacterium RIFCSPHIGHO2_12_FULL_60_33]OGI59217.1 MAG: metal-dependent hydrolase [Candidatus Muproteobacteria bacterium RIFCSPHIGHO2_01_FULL_61_200]